MKRATLKSRVFETPLGSLLAIGDAVLHLLEFTDHLDLENKCKQLSKTSNCEIISGNSEAIQSIEEELKRYFTQELTEFHTPYILHGTDFQKRVWRELAAIPCGETISYAQLAIRIGNPSAFRAVANANSTNKLPLIIPCHRVINTGGKLGGYSSGLFRKKWLLNHEERMGVVHAS